MQDVTPAAEPFRSLPNPSEIFGTIPKDSESFRNVPNHSVRKENHTLTVREVARMFEAAGVARTERSITNWCQKNNQGIPRLDAYLDPNERRYFISPQSVERAIQEEQAKLADDVVERRRMPQNSESLARRVPNEETSPTNHDATLEQKLFDLQVMNRGKDLVINQLRKDREEFALERKDYVEKLIASNRHVGELEAKLLQLDTPGGKVIPAG
jgi:hypothetical protein